jgi:hypothetical protein
VKIFVDKNAEITVNLYAYSEKGKDFFWTKNIQTNKPENITENSLGVESFTIVFRLPTYKDTTEFMDSGVQFSPDGEIRISSGAVSFGRFSKLLKSWSFKTPDGLPVEPTEGNIGLLEPLAAKCIMEDLEQQISV